MGAEVSYQIVHLHDLGTAKTVCPCQKHFWYGLRAPKRNDVCYIHGVSVMAVVDGGRVMYYYDIMLSE